jgi:hypothetical protein
MAGNEEREAGVALQAALSSARKLQELKDRLGDIWCPDGQTTPAQSAAVDVAGVMLGFLQREADAKVAFDGAPMLKKELRPALQRIIREDDDEADRNEAAELLQQLG